MPAMEAAQNALKALNKADINELKAFQKPPPLVRFVMEPVCILLGAKLVNITFTMFISFLVLISRSVIRTKNNNKFIFVYLNYAHFFCRPDWDSTKKLLADVNFIRNLEEYDKDHIPDATLKKIKVYLTHKDFNPDTVVKVSKVHINMVLNNPNY